jgi:hypothetical protein
MHQGFNQASEYSHLIHKSHQAGYQLFSQLRVWGHVDDDIVFDASLDFLGENPAQIAYSWNEDQDSPAPSGLHADFTEF